MNAIEKTPDGFDRVVEESDFRSYGEKWVVEPVDKTRIEARAQLAVLQKENRRLREMLAVAHAGTGLYADDGELQDNREQPFIDFKRDSVDAITGKMARRLERRVSEIPS